MRGFLGVILFALPAAAQTPPPIEALSPGSAPELTRGAYEAFLHGRAGEAEAGYRALAVLAGDAPEPDADLAVILRDRGAAEAALPAWIKASLHEEADSFLWNQRGWSYLALDRSREAKDSFEKALERSTTTASQAEADLGLGMTSLRDSRPKAALPALRDALIQGPYILPQANYQTGLTAMGVGDKQAALAYFRQSLSLDPFQMEALKDLAALYVKIGENRMAWRAYQAALSFDPGDAGSLAALRKASKFVTGDPRALEQVRRLNRNLLPAEEGGAPPSGSTTTVRVSLFTSQDGTPATALRLYFMANSQFYLQAAGQIVRDDARGLEQWEIQFRPETNIVEVRDTVRNVQFTTKQPFRIVPSAASGSVLIKSAEFREGFGFDPGDREVRGILEVIPTPYGMRLVNETRLEEYLYGAVAAALPSGAPSQAYQAQAVLSRTRALWLKAHAAPNIEQADFCDSRACQPYLGLNSEMRDATEAVRATEGWVLKWKGKPARVAQHGHCGGRTDAEPPDETGQGLVSVSDGPGAVPLPGSPQELERFVHSYPPPQRYCEAGSLSAPAEARWIRVLEAREIQRRAERAKPIGRIKTLSGFRRSESGRILSLEIVGADDRLVVEGDAAIRDILSPGSLRSSLFTVQPLYDAGRAGSPSHFVLWGAGTGSGTGLCSAGAVGQASLGRGWRQILGHYFPNLTIEPLIPKPVAAAPRGTGPRRGRNPRKRK